MKIKLSPKERELRKREWATGYIKTGRTTPQLRAHEAQRREQEHKKHEAEKLRGEAEKLRRRANELSKKPRGGFLRTLIFLLILGILAYYYIKNFII